jgi:outer membrane protein assembly factor BamB
MPVLLRRAIVGLAVAIVALVGGAVAMRYVFGMRIVMDGGGGLHFNFPASPDEQAQRIEEHRAAQRTAASSAPTPDSVGPSPSPPAAGGDAASSTAATATTGASSADWPAFRGARRDGIAAAPAIRSEWPVDGLTPMWKQPIGGGYASFAVAGGRAFTIEQRGPREVASAYDVRTGRELWTTAWDALFQEYMGGDGPRATPTWADGVVYVLGATGEFRALEEATGRTIWRVNILDDNDAANAQWGMAASPLAIDDTVVVTPGGEAGRSVVAYDRRTGRRVWSAQDDHAGYAAPMLATLAGVRQIVVFSAARVMGLTPDGGRLLWEYPWQTQSDINAAQPLVVGDSRLFVSSGYGSGAAVIEIAKQGSSLGVREVWRNVRMKNRFNSSVFHDGYIYGFDEAVFACIDAATGDLKWKGGRYGYGQVLLAAGHLVVLTEEGDLALLRATPERHDELARFSAISGKTWNVPAMTGSILLVRNLAEMAAFDLRPR